MKEEENGGGFLSGFILGGLIGAGLALLFAPRTSEEYRGQLREKSIELKLRAEEAAAKAREEADDLLARGRVAFDEQKLRIQEAVEEGRRAASTKKEELMGRYQTAKETGEVPQPTPEQPQL